MNIKKANVDDISKLIHLVYNAYEMHYIGRNDIFRIHSENEIMLELKNIFEDQSRTILLLEEKDITIGYIMFRCNEKLNKSLWIDQFYIENEYRNKGYGKSLLNEVKKHAKNKGINRIELNCWTFNNNALEFYRHLGFKEQRIVFESEI